MHSLLRNERASRPAVVAVVTADGDVISLMLKQCLNRKDTMRATLAMIREKYGSAEGYLKQNTSLTDDDIARIRENLKPSSDDAKL